MRFQPVKCNMMQLTRKHLNKIQASYTLEGAVLESVDNIKYLGVTITNDLKWNTHVSNICTKANRTLGFLRRELFFSCPLNVKEAACKRMVRPILEYGSSVCDPHTDKLQEELEKVQNRAARFVTRNYVYETGSMTGILRQLKWEILRKGERIIDSYCYTKVWKLKPGYLRMTLFSRLDVAGISTPWLFRYPQPVKMSIKIAFSPRLSGTGMTSLNP